MQYEDVAAAYLMKHGFRVLDRNFRRRMGELDIVAMEGDTLVFVEVKFRSSTSFGTPEDAVGRSKKQIIRRMAQMYINIKRIPENTVCRFDVIAINGRGEVLHYRNAFGGLI
jgi:putative endonuclease